MTETRRLYYEDVYKKEFIATVVECREQKKGYAVIVDESAFYPEGGGQPSDVGTLGDAKVTEVHEKEGELLHYTDKALEVGAKVEGKIDWARRFDLMQQHSGEHMVSGIIHEKYGYDNVGFHMGSDVITVDLNGMLDDAQLAEIEREVNERVWEDREVVITYPDAEELKTIDYRSKKELTGQVRIVTFPGVDVCACCGTHVTHTGEIGMVKLLSVVKFHDGIRMEMICGKRVLDYLNMVNEQNHQISMKLSAKMDRTADAVQRLQDENFRMKGQVARMEEEMFRAEAKKWEGAGSVLIFKEGLEADSVRKLADAVMNTCEGCCAVFSRNEDGSYTFVETSGTACELEEGTTYYLVFYVQLYDQLKVMKQETTASVAVDLTDVKTSFYTSLDSFYLSGAKITVTYEDGESESLTFINQTKLYDSRGNLYSYICYNADESDTSKYGIGSNFEYAGTYKAHFTQNGQVLDGEYEITATDPEPSA